MLDSGEVTPQFLYLTFVMLLAKVTISENIYKVYIKQTYVFLYIYNILRFTIYPEYVSIRRMHFE